jgi:hypothetical protein
MEPVLSIKMEHRDKVSRIDNSDILGISKDTDSPLVRCIDLDAFCDNSKCRIEFYGIRDDLIYCPIVSLEAISYDEFMSGVLDIIISKIIDDTDGIGITSKNSGFITLSSGAIIGICTRKFIKDTYNKYYFGDGNKSPYELLLAINKYIAYRDSFIKSRSWKDVDDIFNYCYSRIEQANIGATIEWGDTYIDSNKIKWVLLVNIKEIDKTYRIDIVKDGSTLLCSSGYTEYCKVYECITRLLRSIQEQLDAKREMTSILPEKFIALIDIIKACASSWVSEYYVSCIRVKYEVSSKRYECLLGHERFDGCSISISYSGGNLINIGLSYMDNLIACTIAKNIKIDKFKQYAFDKINKMLSKLEDINDRRAERGEDYI